MYKRQRNNSDKVVGAALFVGLGLGFWQQASGSEAAVYYSPHVLEVRERRTLIDTRCTAARVESQPACMLLRATTRISDVDGTLTNSSLISSSLSYEGVKCRRVARVYRSGR